MIFSAAVDVAIDDLTIPPTATKPNISDWQPYGNISDWQPYSKAEKIVRKLCAAAKPNGHLPRILPLIKGGKTTRQRRIAAHSHTSPAGTVGKTAHPQTLTFAHAQSVNSPLQKDRQSDQYNAYIIQLVVQQKVILHL
jgi:hypothetical protein